MADIVDIGFRVRTQDIEKGYNRLERLGDEAAKAEKQTDKLTKGAKSLGSAFLGTATATAAAVTAITALMNHLANAEREIQASARMAGLTTDQFEAMGFAYRQFGLTVEQVNDIYKDSRERVGEWLSSQSGALQDFGDVMGMSKDQITEFAREVDGLTGQELLQRMVDDMQAAGVSANQMSFALEGMASEATRMIPALENSGKAVNDLSNEYVKFNAAFSLNDDDVQNYADLAKNFDLFLDTAQNGITKTLSPLAELMGVLAAEATEFVAALASGSVSAAERDYSEALEKQLEARRLLGQALALPEAFGDARESEIKIARDSLSAADIAVEAAGKQLEAAKKTAQAQLEINRSSTRNINVSVTGGLTSADTKKQTEEINKQAQAYSRWIANVQDAVDPTIKLREEIDDLWLTMLAGDIDESVAQARIDQLYEQIDGFKKKAEDLESNPFQEMADGATDALSSMSQLFEQGSDESRKLLVAIQAINTAMAVQQAMASATTGNIFGAISAGAGLIGSLDTLLGGDLTPDYEAIQAAQGLNQFGEKAESIADATEITANATEKLVGINTDMLKALTNLNYSISSAAGIIQRNTVTPQVDIGSLGIMSNVFTDNALGNLLSEGMDIFNKLTFNVLGSLGNAIFGAIGGWLGGSSSVTDEGIRIIGGELNDMIEDVTVQAFQSVKYKKWRFGSTKRRTDFVNLGDEVSNQFALVFDSVADSVATGALAIGVSQNQLEAAFESFRLGTTQISLKGLGADARQEAIENYFSRVFNNLTKTVIPFIDEFQNVGEELGTTLARLATEVSIADYLIDNLGVTFRKSANPKVFLQAADNLAALAGGVDALASQVSDFTNAFATDSQKFDIYKEALTSALGEVGLALPATTEGMFDLMASLDASTEAGQQQVATLLGLTETATSYFNLLDKTSTAYRDAAAGLYEITEASRAMSLDSAVAAARLGDFSLAEALDLNSIAPVMSDFSTMFDYNLARAETAVRLNELADLQEGSVSIDEKQLSVLEEIRDKLGTSGTMDSDSIRTELVSLRAQMNKQQTETNDYLRRMAYQGA